MLQAIIFDISFHRYFPLLGIPSRVIVPDVVLSYRTGCVCVWEGIG